MTITTKPPPVRRGARTERGETEPGSAASSTTASGTAASGAAPSSRRAAGTPVKDRPAPRTTPRGPAKSPRRGTAPAKGAPAKGAPATRPSAKKAPATRAPAGGAAPHAPRMPFAMLVIGLLGGALISLLMLRTVLAEDAFLLTKLKQNNRLLAQHEEALSQEVARAESPAEIARKAREAGMRPAPGGFVDEATGQVRGAATTPGRPVPPGGGVVGTDPRIAAGHSGGTGGTVRTAASGQAGDDTRNATSDGTTTDGTTTNGTRSGAGDREPEGDTADDGAIAGGGGR